MRSCAGSRAATTWNTACKDNAREGIDFQLIFPTAIDIPSQNPGPLGAAVARSYNDWAHKLVAGYRDRLSPVAMMPAGCPEEMANELRHCVNELGCKAAHLVSYTKERQMDDRCLFPFLRSGAGSSTCRFFATRARSATPGP